MKETRVDSAILFRLQTVVKQMKISLNLLYLKKNATWPNNKREYITAATFKTNQNEKHNETTPFLFWFGVVQMLKFKWTLNLILLMETMNL
jgi:hypothetical protein